MCFDLKKFSVAASRKKSSFEESLENCLIWFLPVMVVGGVMK